MEKYSKGKLKMGRFEYEGAISRWIGFCIGAAILLISATPLLWVVLSKW